MNTMIRKIFLRGNSGLKVKNENLSLLLCLPPQIVVSHKIYKVLSFRRSILSLAR